MFGSIGLRLRFGFPVNGVRDEIGKRDEIIIWEENILCPTKEVTKWTRKSAQGERKKEQGTHKGQTGLGGGDWGETVGSWW